VDRVHRSCGPQHSIGPHGLTTARCHGLTGASAHERSRPRELAARGPRGRGCGLVLTECDAGRWTAGGEPTTVGDRSATTELDGRAIRERMERDDVRNGKVVWRWCSRVPFIGRGRQEVSRRGRSPVGIEWSPLMATIL
jgi:hypothetical protein